MNVCLDGMAAFCTRTGILLWKKCPETATVRLKTSRSQQYPCKGIKTYDLYIVHLA